MTEILYQTVTQHGGIAWSAAEDFTELKDKEFALDQMTAEQIEARIDLSWTAKILLSAVAGAVIQRLLDQRIPFGEVFAGKMTIR